MKYTFQVHQVQEISENEGEEGRNGYLKASWNQHEINLILDLCPKPINVRANSNSANWSEGVY